MLTALEDQCWATSIRLLHCGKKPSFLRSHPKGCSFYSPLAICKECGRQTNEGEAFLLNKWTFDSFHQSFKQNVSYPEEEVEDDQKVSGALCTHPIRHVGLFVSFQKEQ